jgi:hypothetical protein
LTTWLAISSRTWFTLLKMFVHAWAKDTNHHLSEAIQKCSVVSGHYFLYSLPYHSKSFLFLCSSSGISLS